MSKIKINKHIYIVIIFMICIMSILSNIYADDIDDKQRIEQTKTEQDEIEKKAKLNIIVKDCIDELRQSINNIDKKVQILKEQEEYGRYPAIRLNIDTPFFGLSSSIDQKLKVKKDISAVDVASGYSIRDIIRTSTIKVPNYTVASVIVVTRDVKLDESATISDLNTIILKLMQYISQVKSVDKYVDKQINSIFNGYIQKEKSDKISELKKRLDTITGNLNKEVTPLINIGIISSFNEEYSSYLNEYNDILRKIYEVKNNVNNILITNSDLETAQKSILDIESKIIDFSKNINNSYEISKTRMNVGDMLTGIKSNLETRKKYIDKYVENSILKENINGNGIEDVKEQPNITEKPLYNLISKNLIDYLQNILVSIDKKIIVYVPEKVENNEGGQVEVKEISMEQKEGLLKELNSLYVDYINKENKFYLDNLNLMLKDTTEKISSMSKYTDKNSLLSMKYIYVELPNTIEYLLKTNDTKVVIQTQNLNDKLKIELDNIVKTNIEINELYNKADVENIKKLDRE